MRESDIVVIGSSLYWHNICGSVRDMDLFRRVLLRVKRCILYFREQLLKSGCLKQENIP